MRNVFDRGMWKLLSMNSDFIFNIWTYYLNRILRKWECFFATHTFFSCASDSNKFFTFWWRIVQVNISGQIKAADFAESVQLSPLCCHYGRDCCLQTRYRFILVLQWRLVVSGRFHAVWTSESTLLPELLCVILSACTQVILNMFVCGSWPSSTPYRILTWN